MRTMPLADQIPIIQVEDFTAAYDGTVIIDDMWFDVYPGEVFVILGGSGAARARC